jgi:hypothetical protein
LKKRGIDLIGKPQKNRRSLTLDCGIDGRSRKISTQADLIVFSAATAHDFDGAVTGNREVLVLGIKLRQSLDI